MRLSRRLVVLDPGMAAPVGHHADVNAQLAQQLQHAGWQPEVWADAAASAQQDLQALIPGLRPVLHEAGYLDPRHWCDLPGSLHQAGQLRPQLIEAARGEPVAVWLAHSLLPFQLIALAQVLQTQPAAQVVISLMFAPGELFAGQPDHDLASQRQAASLNTSTALAALAAAVQRGGHRLLLCSGCLQLIERFTPLCQAAGLAIPLLHPAVVLAEPAADAGRSPQRPPSPGPRVLLHWGERKPDKGRNHSLVLLEHLLSGAPLPAALQNAHWCFHAAGAPPPAQEAALLKRAQAHSNLTLLEGHLARPRMLDELASCDLALLPYCPQAYAERSSGVLWLYAARRLSQGLPARVLGFPASWLEREARLLGIGWQPISPAPDGAQLLQALADAISAPPTMPGPQGLQVLRGSFPAWLAQQLIADKMP